MLRQVSNNIHVFLSILTIFQYFIFYDIAILTKILQSKNNNKYPKQNKSKRKLSKT